MQIFSKKYRKFQKGYIALSSVLLISLVVIAIAITVAQLAIGEGQAGLAVSKGDEVLNLVEGCVEDALMNVQKSSSYTGAKTITRPEGTCSVTVTSGVTWQIVALNTSSTQYVRTITVTFTRGTAIDILTWKES